MTNSTCIHYLCTKRVTKGQNLLFFWNFGTIPWNLGKWYSGDASSMFLLIIVAIEHPLFKWAQMRNHLLYDRFHRNVQKHL